MADEQMELQLPLLGDGYTAIPMDDKEDEGCRYSNTQSTQVTEEKMHYAADVGNARALEQLVRTKKEEVRKTDEFGYTPLHLAAKGVHLQCCEILLKASPKGVINLPDKLGNTPLMLAITSGNTSLEITKLLLQNKAKVDISNKASLTPLHIASEKGNLEICRILVEKDAKNINAGNKEGQTPLHFAAKNGHSKVCRFLIEKGSSVEAKDVQGYTALHTAARMGFTECCNQLLLCNSSVHSTDKKGNTPLHVLLYTKKNKPNCLEVLCKNGAKMSVKNDKGEAPIHIAQHAPNEMLQKMLSFEYDPLIRDGNGKTILHWAASRQSIKNIETILALEIWKTRDVDTFINAQDADGHTALHIAIKHRHDEACKILLKRGADGNFTCGCHGTALHMAAENGLSDICDLLAKSVKVNSRNKDLMTPLHLAAKAGQEKCCEILLSRRASPAEEDSNQNTPLHLAAMNGKAACCQVIVKRQPSVVNKRNGEEKTPLHNAVEKKSLECCKVLMVSHTDIWISSRNIPSVVKMAYEKRYQDIFTFLLLSENVQGKYRHPTIDIDIQAILRDQIYVGNSQMVSTILDSRFGEECLLPQRNPGDSHYSQNNNFRLLVQHLPLLAQKVLDACSPVREHEAEEESKLIVHLLDEVYIPFDDSSQDKEPSLTPTETAYQKVISENGQLKPDVRLEEKVDHAWQRDHVLSWMVRYGREDLVNHPVVTCWLNYKWEKYVRYGHYLSVTFALLLAVLLSVFNSISLDWALMATKFTAPITREIVCVNFTGGPEVVPYMKEEGHPANVLSWIITVLIIILMIFEIYKIVRLRLRYIKTLTVIYWLCMLMSFLFVGNYTSCSHLTHIREDIQWLAGLAAIILAWLHLLILAWMHPRNPFAFNFKRFFRAAVAIVPPLAIVGVAVYAVFEIGSKGSLSYSHDWQVLMSGLVSLPMMGTAVVVGLASFIYLDVVNARPRKRDRTLDEGNIQMTLEFDILCPFLRKRFYVHWIGQVPKEHTRSSFKNLWRILECRNDDEAMDSPSWGERKNTEAFAFINGNYKTT
ncbi:ankyrin-1-like isoform X2 [Penaeus japonicus]|uniref:ankyrin-1-like isoform X2 n=1 Tax=Penaeus japonicus TaxID=27405 RepID=UPI001C70E933|nr:ankyrin-1-like isoform X2 [Penaeus japonicus]